MEEETKKKFDKVVFERKITNVGGSSGIYIPKELLKFIEAEQGDIIELCGDISKHGNFIGIWNPKQQEKRNAAINE